MKQVDFRHKDDRYIELLNQFCTKRHAFANYYGIDNDDVDYVATESSMVIKANEVNFSRIYVMSDNEQELIDILKCLPKNCAINIPSRNGIESWKSILENVNFYPYAVFRRYKNDSFDEGDDKGIDYAKEIDLTAIKEQLNLLFSQITSHAPKGYELLELIRKKQVLVHRDDKGKVNGALCIKIGGTKAEFAFWFDTSKKGISLYLNAFSFCHKNEIKFINMWINDQNVTSKSIQTFLGAKEDGLVDYTYTNFL